MQQQEVIFELVAEEREPSLRPPVSAASLARLQSAFAAAEASIPRSWAAFLDVSDGVADFSLSYDLHGADEVAQQLESGVGRAVCAALVGATRADGDGLVLIGSHGDTTTRLCLDTAHAPSEVDEAVVLEGDPGSASLHPSFIAYLRMRVDANALTIERLTDGERMKDLEGE